VDTHELAINWADGIAYTKNAAGNIVTVTLGGGGGGSGEDAVLRALFVPAAPTSVTATAGNAQATVSWTAPTGVLAQAPVSDYVVQFSSNSGSTWTTVSRTASTTASQVVTSLTNGTAYTFRVAAANAVGTGPYSTASIAVTPVAGDPLFGSVALLLHMDGSGSTFVDSSPQPKAITANGNATQSATQSKFGGKSAAFDGSGDSLSVPSITLGTGDFVVECWLYLNSVGGSYTGIYDARPNSNGAHPTLILSGSSIAWFTNAGFRITGSELSTGQWYHVAVARASGSTRMYVDGTQVGSTYSDSTNYGSSSAPFIGRLFDGYELNGNIDEFRITVGSSRGMTGATITVPTAAFPEAVPGTDPLFGSVSLLLPMDGTGSTFIDASATTKTITALGATQSATQSRWGGKSAFFTGTSRLSSSTSSAFAFGTGDFCVEMWVYPSGTSAFQTLFSTRSSNTGEDSSNVFFGFNTGTLTPIVYTNGLVLTGSSSLSAETWSHIAFVRESGVISIYLNGTRIGNTSFTTSITGTNASVGLTQNSEHQFSGYIDDVRVTSSSRYTGSTITVPTAAFPTA
jgi:hypothetical protein